MTPPLPDGLRHARTLSLALGLALIATGLRDLTGILPRWDPATVAWVRLSSGSALPNSSWVSLSMRGSSASGTPSTSITTCRG